MIQKMIRLISIVGVVVLTGCAGMADMASRAGGHGIVSVDEATFDGETIVEVTPNWLYDPEGSWNRVQLGGRWSSGSPDWVALLLSYRSSTSDQGSVYIDLEAIEIRVDSKVSRFEAGRPSNLSSGSYNTVTSSISTQSRNAIIVPLHVVSDMLAFEDVRLRVYTSEGYEDSVFSVERMPGGQGTAILSFREFFDQINTFKK